MLLATLSTRVTVGTTTSGALLPSSVRVFSDPFEGVVVTVDVNEEAANLLLPSLQARPGGGPRVPGTRIEAPAFAVSYLVDGEEIEAAVLSPVEVTADLDQCSRRMELVTQASTGSRRGGDYRILGQGTELIHSGPPPGKGVPQNVNLRLFGLAPGTAISGTSTTYSLIASAFSDESERQYSEAAHELRISANCEEPWREREVEIELEAGHGLTHGEIVRLALAAGGVPEERIGVSEQLGAPRFVKVQTGCVRLWDFIHEVLGPIGYVVMANKTTGVFQEVSLDVGEVPAVTLSYDDLLISAPLRISATTGVASCAKVEGRRRDAGARQPEEGRVTTIATVEIFDPDFVPRVPLATQDPGSGAIIPTGILPPAPSRTRTARTIVRSTTLAGCPERVETTQERFFNPREARYTAQGTDDGEPRGYTSGFFFDGIPAPDDSAQMFAWDRDRFVITDRQVQIPQYDASGQKISEEVQCHGWKNPEAPIKTRANASIPWDSQLFVTGRFLDADGTGRLFSQQLFFAGPDPPGSSFPNGLSARPELPVGTYGRIVGQAVQVATTNNEIDECKQIISRSETVRAIKIKNGIQALYVSAGDGSGPNAQGLDSTRLETFLAVTDDSVDVVSTGTDSQGDPTDIEIQRGATRGFPAAEICNDESLRERGTQTFEVLVCIERLVDGEFVADESRTEILQSDFVETEAEAQAWADRWLRFELGPTVPLALASPLPAIDVGQTIRLAIPEFLYDGDPPSESMDGVLWTHKTAISGGSDDHKALDNLEIRIPLKRS